jgi:hypothetical protein
VASGLNTHAGGTSKADFERLAEMRIREARLLLAAGAFDGALHLGGYAVECALKAIIAKSILAHTFPSSKRDVDAWFVHDLAQLLAIAGLAEDMKKNHDVSRRWSVVLRWKETKRYERGLDQTAATDFCDCVDDAKDGVLPWLRLHW